MLQAFRPGLALLGSVLGLVLGVSIAGGQAPKLDLPQLPGQADGRSLPVHTKPTADARQDLGQKARTTENGVFFVGARWREGNNEVSSHGTAWVISKKNRLLITNAHVADIYHQAGGRMIAIASGSEQVYKVAKVLYHPGVRRYLKGAQLSVRSSDPRDGSIDPASPDLAVLQLTDDGPALKVEFPLATEEELATLFAQPVAIIGFPGHDNKTWPALGASVAATYHDGVVQRLTNFQMNPSVPPHELLFVQYTMATWGGFSGSPIFLPNGHVVAVHNMGRTERNGEVVRSIPHGIRADCVIELLVHHNLTDKMPFAIDKFKVRLDRWIKPDARTEKALADFARAQWLVEEAHSLVFAKEEHEKGWKKCTEAIDLVPNYAHAYRIRSAAFSYYYFKNYKTLPQKTASELVMRAFKDIEVAVRLEPSNPGYVLDLCLALNNIAYVTKTTEPSEKVLQTIEKLLTADNLTQDIRGNAMKERAGAYDRLGDIKAAWRDYNEAVRLNPNEIGILEDRAIFLETRELGDRGRADRARVQALRQQYIQMGMKLTEIASGGAAETARLRVGDIVISVGSTRVRNHEELVAALAAAKGPVSLEIINGQTKKRESVAVTPVAGKIGVSVEQVPLN
jgi:tetratricopeptide (TPR) repeat protein